MVLKRLKLGLSIRVSICEQLLITRKRSFRHLLSCWLLLLLPFPTVTTRLSLIHFRCSWTCIHPTSACELYSSASLDMLISCFFYLLFYYYYYLILIVAVKGFNWPTVLNRASLCSCWLDILDFNNCAWFEYLESFIIIFNMGSLLWCLMVGRWMINARTEKVLLDEE